MATKQQLVDTFYRRLTSTHPGYDAHRKEVEQNMARAWNQLLYDTFRMDLTFLDFYAKDYQSQSVSQDATTKQYYVDLPAAIVQLPDKSAGVRSVEGAGQDFSTPVGVRVKFKPMSDTMLKLAANLDATLADTSIIGYAVRYDKILFDQNMTSALASAGVHLKLVVPFDVYTSTEKLPVPAGKDEQLYILTMQFMFGTVPQNQ